MMRHRFRFFATAGLAALTLVLAGGCNAEGCSITFLDFLNTVFLGITAAGGVVLIQNI